ncbi:ImmA/IrrE family metallo-endopeptidase [Laribacter hongkongensis]|uniref:ImmA/IrrE family metallo-endopeptidase n=1 Tax=Laribacter hongkongensis TaxID=168471 RepID=UPI001EFCF033|nr:ImmA/IrrE family metallo-endopeptidase [Laribacter hongkongensis]MCG8998426.1 ImmA/IrrE family metallo-endopeptidase [Laribacter hongkongensis]MCG9013595.1 ImmA/IrrE family metallo-endopeptidase [Laribacter hongkongensis]MCG9045107.1 ImmA/IrrE family metallo-endopeptidase [Laribacter hongkongensis]
MTTPTELLHSHWDGKLPINIDRIAERLGIEVCPVFGMQGKFSGCIEKTDTGAKISLDITESIVRQRFTVAHEIGHFALGHLKESGQKFRDGPDTLSGKGSVEEREANSFAAELLMPESLLKYVITVRNITEIDKLANLFNVSQIAMKYRLTNLGIL